METPYDTLPTNVETRAAPHLRRFRKKWKWKRVALSSISAISGNQLAAQSYGPLMGLR